MHHSESRAPVDRRFIWISVFAVALWLSLVNAGAAFAGGEDSSAGQGSWSDQGGADTQHDTGEHSPSWGDTPDEGHPPPEAPAPEEPCEEEGPPEGGTPPEEKPPEWTPPEEKPPAETPPGEEKPPVETPPDHEKPPGEKPPDYEKPPAETPPEETPPVETPPVQTPPVETPPVQTPPVETPPVQTPPVESPPAETPPAETPTESPTAPVAEERGDVLPQEAVGGGGGQEAPAAPVTETGVQAAPAGTTLPFTGSHGPWLVLIGLGFLGLGVGLRRVIAREPDSSNSHQRAT
jgi:hypothetical protein